MPANKKYLLKSPWARTSKIIAAILGSLLATLSIHYTLALWVDMSAVIATSLYSIFIVWTLFMLLVYKIKSPTKAWLVLLTIVAIGAIAIVLKKYEYV